MLNIETTKGNISIELDDIASAGGGMITFEGDDQTVDPDKLKLHSGHTYDLKPGAMTVIYQAMKAANRIP